MGGNNVRHSKYHQNVFSPSTQPLSQTAVVAPTDQRSTCIYTPTTPITIPLAFHINDFSFCLIFHLLLDLDHLYWADHKGPTFK